MIDYNYDFSKLAEMDADKAVKEAKALAKGSPLTALTLILGIVATKMTDNLMDLALKLGEIKDDKMGFVNNPENAGKDPGDRNETFITALLQSETQKLSMFMQALNNAIKSLGEAETAVARKG